MCGISGAIIKKESDIYWNLLKVSEIRGQDGTGVAYIESDSPSFGVRRSDYKASEAYELSKPYGGFVKPLSKGEMIIGQNRLAIFGLGHENDQPLFEKEVIEARYALVHNGNLLNFDAKFKELGLKRELQVDSELILRFIESKNPKSKEELVGAIKDCLATLEGNMACILIDKVLGVMAAFTRYKPLYYVDNELGIFFFSTDRIGGKVFKGQTFTEVKNNQVVLFNDLGTWVN